MEDIDYLAALEGIPDDMAEFATPEDIHQLMSSDDWMSDSTGLAGQSDSLTDLSTRPSVENQRVQPTASEAPSVVHDPGHAVPVAEQQAPVIALRNLSTTKVAFLRTIYELSKRRDSEGIVSLDDIRNAHAELASLNKTGKQGALHALVRTHHLVVYLKDFDPAMKSKYKLTPAGLSLCQKEFE
jgi:hypothetical protein